MSVIRVLNAALVKAQHPIIDLRIVTDLAPAEDAIDRRAAAPGARGGLFISLSHARERVLGGPPPIIEVAERLNGIALNGIMSRVVSRPSACS